MKLQNLLLIILFWLNVLNVAQTDQIDLYSTNDPPDKKPKLCTTESGQDGSNTIDTQNPACASQCSEGSCTHVNTFGWNSNFQEADLFAYLGLNVDDFKNDNANEKNSENTNGTHLNSTGCFEVPADDKGPEDPDAENSNATIPYGFSADQASLIQIADPDEESRGNMSTEKRPEVSPDPFLIAMEVAVYASDIFYVFSEPVLDFKKQIVLRNKTCRYFFSKGPIKSFIQREHLRNDYCYLVFLRFKNVRNAFNSRNSARVKGLFRNCKERFSSKLENFQQNEFGNEIILDASFQILVFKLWINKNLDLTFLDRVDFLFSLVFDQGNNEGTKDPEYFWEGYKRSIGFKGPPEAVKLFSVNEIRYSGILSKKEISSDDKKKRGKLNAEFMTLESKEGKLRSNVYSVTTKGVKVKFLQVPKFENKTPSTWAYLYNKHLVIEAEFTNTDTHLDYASPS